MSRRRKIDRDAMLEEFGYRPERMTKDAKTAAATHMEDIHKLEHFYIPGKKQRHYWLDQVITASEPIEA